MVVEIDDDDVLPSPVQLMLAFRSSVVGFSCLPSLAYPQIYAALAPQAHSESQARRAIG